MFPLNVLQFEGRCFITFCHTLERYLPVSQTVIQGRKSGAIDLPFLSFLFSLLRQHLGHFLINCTKAFQYNHLGAVPIQPVLAYLMKICVFFGIRAMA